VLAALCCDGLGGAAAEGRCGVATLRIPAVVLAAWVGRGEGGRVGLVGSVGLGREG
jgi:hypothetical protein